MSQLNWNIYTENPSWITLHKDTIFQDTFSKIGYWVYIKMHTTDTALKQLAEDKLAKLLN